MIVHSVYFRLLELNSDRGQQAALGQTLRRTSCFLRVAWESQGQAIVIITITEPYCNQHSFLKRLQIGTDRVSVSLSQASLVNHALMTTLTSPKFTTQSRSFGRYCTTNSCEIMTFALLYDVTISRRWPNVTDVCNCQIQDR